VAGEARKTGGKKGGEGKGDRRDQPGESLEKIEVLFLRVSVSSRTFFSFSAARQEDRSTESPSKRKAAQAAIRAAKVQKSLNDLRETFEQGSPGEHFSLFTFKVPLR